MPIPILSAVGAATAGGATAAGAGTAAAGAGAGAATAAGVGAGGAGAAGVAGVGTAVAGGAGAAGFLQPWMVPLASFGVKQIGNLIAPNRQGEIIQSVLQSQIDFRDQIARRAFGRLTPRDHQQLQMQAEPQVNAIAGNVASRGLGSSPAGAAIVGDAQAQAYSQARQEALQALPMYDQNLMRTFATLRTDNSFNEDIDTTAQLLYDLLNKKKQNNEPMPTMDSTMAWLAQFLALAKSGM